MLSRMAPSSPPDMRTLHLLRTPDILCANDSRQFGNYQLNSTAQDCLLLRNFRIGGHSPGTKSRKRKTPYNSTIAGLTCFPCHGTSLARSNASLKGWDSRIYRVWAFRWRGVSALLALAGSFFI